MARKILIVGGGIAGLTTAYTLLKQGRAAARPFEVTVLEAESLPGGCARAYPIQPKAPHRGEISGEKPFIVEHGSHVFFNFYDTIVKIIAELRADEDPGVSAGMPGVLATKGWTIVDAYGHRATLAQKGRWRVPYDVFGSMLGISWLPLVDRLRIGVGTLSLLRRPYDDFGRLDQMTSKELGLASGYSELGLLAWNSASLGLTNLFIQEQSGALFCAKHKVLIDYPDGLSYHIPTGDLSALIANPMKKKSEELGAVFLMNATATSVARPPGAAETTVTYRTPEGEAAIEADQVILAIPPSAAKGLVPWVRAPWTELVKTSPVITAVLRLSDRLSTSADGRELGLSREQWAFSVVTDLSRSWPAYQGQGKTVLRCEIGHADRFPAGVDTADDEVIKLLVLDLARLFPEITERGIVVEAYAIHRETNLLYTRWARGQWSKKPKERDVGQGVFLAGDWTTKGTIGMEAAANSGIEAANHVLLSAGLPPVLFRDVPL
jgi:protoporphyrinogen oxidase